MRKILTRYAPPVGESMSAPLDMYRTALTVHNIQHLLAGRRLVPCVALAVTFSIPVSSNALRLDTVRHRHVRDLARHEVVRDGIDPHEARLVRVGEARWRWNGRERGVGAHHRPAEPARDRRAERALERP
jgi:hypothetical protein